MPAQSIFFFHLMHCSGKVAKIIGWCTSPPLKLTCQIIGLFPKPRVWRLPCGKSWIRHWNVTSCNFTAQTLVADPGLLRQSPNCKKGCVNLLLGQYCFPKTTWKQECIPVGCVLSTLYIWGGSLSRDIIQRPLLPVNRMTDIRLWKHYLAPNFVGGR